MKKSSPLIGLQLASTSLLLTAPLAAWQYAVLQRSPLWRMPWQEMQWVALSVFLPMLVPVFGLIRGRKFWIQVLKFLSWTWALSSLGLAIYRAQSELGFFAIAIAGFSYMALSWVEREMTRSYFDPKVSWFQGAPKPLPGLSVSIKRGDGGWEAARVANMDVEGTMIFSDGFRSPAKKSKQMLDLVFTYRGRELRARGSIARWLPESASIGVKFGAMAPDHQKDLRDFVESLRGEGHV